MACAQHVDDKRMLMVANVDLLNVLTLKVYILPLCLHVEDTVYSHAVLMGLTVYRTCQYSSYGLFPRYSYVESNICYSRHTVLPILERLTALLAVDESLLVQ